MTLCFPCIKESGYRFGQNAAYRTNPASCRKFIERREKIPYSKSRSGNGHTLIREQEKKSSDEKTKIAGY